MIKEGLNKKEGNAGEVSTAAGVHLDSPPESPEDVSSTLRRQFSLVEGILGSLTNCWSDEVVVFD